MKSAVAVRMSAKPNPGQFALPVRVVGVVEEPRDKAWTHPV